jgi:DNA polymerase-3 subunit alpha
MVYQEQVMQIANAVAGFSLGEADVLRRAMGKKKIEEMVSMREKFVAGAVKNKVPEAKARKLFEQIQQFAGYGFNKSHSAAYALVAFRTAYLKTHYPVEFMAAMLTAEIGNPDKLTFYLGECRDMAIEILPPDVNSSDRTFTPARAGSGLAIRFGLTAIKNVGESAIESVIEARKRLGRFDNLFQFCENVDLRLMNKRVIESLIKAGAMDSLGVHRARMMAGLDRAIELGQARQRATSAGQAGLFGGTAEPEPVRAVELPQVAEWSEAERLAGEKEVLGYFVTGHPLEKFRAQIAASVRHDSASLDDLGNDAPVSVAGIVTNLRVKPSKKTGELYAAAVLEDLRGSLELLVFPKTLQQIQGLLRNDAVLLVKGRIRRDEASAKPKVIVNEAQALETVAARGNGKAPVRIRVDLDRAPEGIVDALQALMAEHPGSDTLVFELVRQGDFRATMRPRRPTGIKADPNLLAELRALGLEITANAGLAAGVGEA